MTRPPTSPLPSQLPELCLEHLEREEAALRATLAILAEDAAVLRSGNLEALHTVAARQAELAQAAEEIKALRGRFRDQAALLLALPSDQITLTVLAERLPAPSADQVLERRRRLRELAAAVDRLNTENAGLLFYCLDFLHRFVDDLTGRRATGRYGPHGKPEAVAGGHLLDVRG